MAHEHDTTTEVLDPVCGMSIFPEDAVGHVEHHGHTYYFCNESCLEKFKADPKRYLEPEAAPPAAAGSADVEYTCPMHPQVRQLGPGSCPKCGMALEPVPFSPRRGAPSTRVRCTLRFFGMGREVAPSAAWLLSPEPFQLKRIIPSSER